MTNWQGLCANNTLTDNPLFVKELVDTLNPQSVAVFYEDPEEKDKEPTLPQFVRKIISMVDLYNSSENDSSDTAGNTFCVKPVCSEGGGPAEPIRCVRWRKSVDAVI